MDMQKKIIFILVTLLVVMSIAACGGGPSEEETSSGISIGPVTINAHPTSLEGKTVVLRWNSKPNGDKYLTRIGELLTEQVKDIKIIKLWESDPSTAAISKTVEDSVAVADKIAALNPDLVIAAQCD
jgi:ABC-type Fe3+-hydroxamate transport system substrate-binding protein